MTAHHHERNIVMALGDAISRTQDALDALKGAEGLLAETFDSIDRSRKPQLEPIGGRIPGRIISVTEEDVLDSDSGKPLFRDDGTPCRRTAILIQTRFREWERCYPVPALPAREDVGLRTIYTTQH